MIQVPPIAVLSSRSSRLTVTEVPPEREREREREREVLLTIKKKLKVGKHKALKPYRVSRLWAHERERDLAKSAAAKNL